MSCYLCCGLKGNLSTDGKSGAQLIGFGRCDANKCNSRPGNPRVINDKLGNEFYNGASNCGSPYTNGSAPQDQKFNPLTLEGRPRGTPGTSSTASIGFGRSDIQVGCCSGGPPARFSASKTFLFNCLR